MILISKKLKLKFMFIPLKAIIIDEYDDDCFLPEFVRKKKLFGSCADADWMLKCCQKVGLAPVRAEGNFENVWSIRYLLSSSVEFLALPMTHESHSS